MKKILALSFVALLAVTARGDDWPSLGRDAARTRVPAETMAAPALLGSTATGATTLSSPVSSDGYLVSCGVDGVVRVYAEDDLAPVWSASTGTSIVSTPLVYRGRIFVAGTDGVLRTLRLADGAALGELYLGGTVYASPVLSGTRLFITCGFPGPALVAVDINSNSIAWSAALDQVTYASPAVGGGKAVALTNNGTTTAFDEATGGFVWSADLGAGAGASAPLILSGSVYCFCEGTITRLDLATGSVVGTPLTLTDTAPADMLSVKISGSPLALAGGLLVGVVRFDYALDHVVDGYVDAWTLREFAFAVDPGAPALATAWTPVLIGQRTDVDLNAIPPYGLLPSPVSLGTTAAVLSSLDSTLRFITLASGAATGSALDAPSQASPLLANARLVAMTTAGTLYSFEDSSTPQPARASGLTPSAIQDPTTAASLSWTGAGSAYLIRLSHDGELLMNWDFETSTGATSIALPPPSLTDWNAYTWGVRVRSASGAYSPWTTATFGRLSNAPAPPGALTATPGNRSVHLSWAASASSSVVGYRLTTTPSGGGPSVVVDLGTVTSTTVSSLTGGVSYDFALRSMDVLGTLSTPVTATATPLILITIGGAQYDTLADALGAALSGETVNVGAGIFLIDAPLDVPQSVELRGLNGRDTWIEASGDFEMIQAQQDSTIRSLGLSGGSIGVKTLGSNVTIRNCVIRGMSDAGVDATNTASVINNTIVENIVAGVRASGPSGAVDARNNIVQQNGVGFTGAITSQYNDVLDGYESCVPGVGDLSALVLFLDAAARDYREQASQPSLDTGAPADDYSQEPALNGGRINLGAFGNTSLAATTPALAKAAQAGGLCGLTGLEVLLLLALLRRRR